MSSGLELRMLVLEGFEMALVGQDSRAVVHDLVVGVVPLDEHEAQDKATTSRWVRSGAPLFRIARPATLDQHLCVYFALFDEARRTVLLVNHVKAGLWLFPGGHVNDSEDPRTTVLREANEVRWFALDDPAEWAHDRFDLHMARFRDKLLARLGTPVLVGPQVTSERPSLTRADVRSDVLRTCPASSGSASSDRSATCPRG